MASKTAPKTESRRPHVKCEQCSLRDSPVFRPFSPSEFEWVREHKSGELAVAAGSTILLEDTNSPHLFTIYQGWAFRHTALPDGSRQILNYALPGDLLGLQTAMFDKMEHSVDALTDVLLCVFEREQIWKLFNTTPELAFDVTWLAARQERIMDAKLLTVGQRNAKSRVAYIMLHLHARTKRLGLGDEKSCEWPITQEHLADTTGLSKPYLNEVIRALAEEKLARVSDKKLTILDRDGLVELAQYDVARDEMLRPFL